MDEAQENTGKGSALRALVSFFTIWQQDITQADMDEMERKFHLVPLIGLFFSVLIVIEMTVLIAIAAKWGYGSGMLWSAVVLATVYGGSKFIHFDGLTDFGDGMIVSGTREDHIRALKDTLVGAGGIGVALIVVLFSYSVYATAMYYLLIFAPLTELVVKNAMVVAAAYGEPGNGMAGRQVSMTTRDSMIRSTVITLAVGAVLGIALAWFTEALLESLYGIAIYQFGVAPVFCLLFGVAASIAVGYLMARKANGTFGMVNGDILGATNEIARPIVMLAMLIPFFAWL